MYKDMIKHVLQIVYACDKDMFETTYSELNCLGVGTKVNLKDIYAEVKEDNLSLPGFHDFDTVSLFQDLLTIIKEEK